ncbi:MAG: hypothetical protein U0795_01435 [Pirellulales bacterium]
MVTDFAIYLMIVLATVISGRLAGIPLLICLWAGIALQPVGFYLVQNDLIRTGISDAMSMDMRLAALLVPIAFVVLAGGLSRIGHTLKPKLPTTRKCLQLSLGELLMVLSVPLPLFWLFYPLDFHSPHDFHLPYLVRVYDAFYISAVDLRSVTGWHIDHTLAVLHSQHPQRIGLPALAVAIIAFTIISALATVTQMLVANRGERWYQMSVELRRAVAASGLASVVTAIVLLLLVTQGFVLVDQLSYRMFVPGIAGLIAIPVIIAVKSYLRHKTAIR